MQVKGKRYTYTQDLTTKNEIDLTVIDNKMGKVAYNFKVLDGKHPSQMREEMFNPLLLKNPLTKPEEFPRDKAGQFIDIDDWRHKSLFEVIGFTWESGELDFSSQRI